MSNEEGAHAPQEEGPKQSSTGIAVLFFLVPLALLILFAVLSKQS